MDEQYLIVRRLRENHREFGKLTDLLKLVRDNSVLLAAQGHVIVNVHVITSNDYRTMPKSDTVVLLVDQDTTIRGIDNVMRVYRDNIDNLKKIAAAVTYTETPEPIYYGEEEPLTEKPDDEAMKRKMTAFIAARQGQGLTYEEQKQPGAAPGQPVPSVMAPTIAATRLPTSVAGMRTSGKKVGGHKISREDESAWMAASMRGFSKSKVDI